MAASEVCTTALFNKMKYAFLYHITLVQQTCLFFVDFLKDLLLFLGDKVDEESGKFSNSKNSASDAYKSVAYKKIVCCEINN